MTVLLRSFSGSSDNSIPYQMEQSPTRQHRRPGPQLNDARTSQQQQLASTCLHLSAPVRACPAAGATYPCLSVPIRAYPCPALFAASLVPCTCRLHVRTAHLRPCADRRGYRCYVADETEKSPSSLPASLSRQVTCGVVYCPASNGNAGRSAAPLAQRIVACGVCGDVCEPQDREQRQTPYRSMTQRSREESRSF